MADINLSATVSRDLLGLWPLQIGSGGRYYLGPSFLGGNVQWNRQKASSPFVDGEVTTQRSRQNVTEAISVEIRAETHEQLQAYTAELLVAFLQDQYTLTVTVDGGSYAYRCEAADYQVATWTTPRLYAKQGQVVFSVPRRPVALIGGV